jgi:hypothetical protein
VPAEKIKDIVDKLCPLMPSNRRDFWREYPTNNTVVDLISNYGEIEDDTTTT